MNKLNKYKNIADFKKDFRSFVKTRDGVTIVSWAVGIVLILGAGIPVATINRTYELATMVFIVCILATCSLITVFARYVDSEMFPFSAYFQVGIIYFLSLSSIGLLAIDLCFTLYNRYYDDLEQLQKTQTFIAILWNVIYWGNFVFATVLNQFYTSYWQNGHFAVMARIKYTVKGLVIRIIAAGIAGAIVFVLVFIVLKVRDISGIKAMALVFTNILNMVQLVILLAYGLFNLPIFLWKFADNKQTLYKELEHAHQVRHEYRSALSDYQLILSQCRNMIRDHRSGANTDYMDILQQELPKTDLEGNEIQYSENFTLDNNQRSSDDYTMDYIASVRQQFRIAYFLYKRKYARWSALYRKIDSLIEQPVKYEPEYLKKDLNKLDELPVLDEMSLKPKPNDAKQITFYRIAAVVALFFCLFVLTTEATVIYHPKYTLMYIIVEDHPTWKYRNWSFSIVFLACIVFVCFFTIFNSRFSDFLQLEVKHTDCLRLSSVVSWCCKIITISCWNYMVILGEVAPGMEEYLFGTCYADFYSSMIKLPFLGSYFNTIMPVFIMVFGAMFAFISLFKLKSKTLSAVKNFTKKNLVEEGAGDVKADSAALPRPAPAKAEGKSKKDEGSNQEAQSIVQQILFGERAILLEIDLLRRQEERSKLLRFNNMSAIEALHAQRDIELAAKVLKDTKKKDESTPKASQQLPPAAPMNPKSVQALIAAAKAKRDGDESLAKPLLNQGGGMLSGQRKMNYLMFKKAEIKEEEEEEMKLPQESYSEEETVPKKAKSPFQKLKNDSNDSDEDNKKKKPLKKGVKMDVDSEEDTRTQKKKTKKQVKSIFDEDSEEQEAEAQRILAARNKKGLGKFNKEGVVLKKKRRSVITQWDKKYLVLENGKLLVYTDSSRKTLKKTLDLASGNVTAICFHYDKDAPIQSKRIDIKDKDDSRFDVYVKTPILRPIMFKVEDQNQFQAEDWVSTLQAALKHYAPPFDPEMPDSKPVMYLKKKL